MYRTIISGGNPPIYLLNTLIHLIKQFIQDSFDAEQSLSERQSRTKLTFHKWDEFNQKRIHRAVCKSLCDSDENIM